MTPVTPVPHVTLRLSCGPHAWKETTNALGELTASQTACPVCAVQASGQEIATARRPSHD